MISPGKRYIFIGSVDYSAYCLKALLEMGINIVDIMCPVREAAKFNNDYYDLENVARDFGKNVYYFKKIGNEIDHVREKNPDVIFVLGLSQIVPLEILKIPSIGCIGSHPALLPQNRGRHPIIWAIANGLRKSGITLLWLDEGIDSGNIWGQEEFEIRDEDDASTIYEKVKKLSVKIIKDNISDLEKGMVRKVGQDNSMANYWRKRSKNDGGIDWRMSTKRIHDLVRALTNPYVGAHCVYNGKEIKIWKTRTMENAGEYANLEPGKVISATNSLIRIKTGDGMIEILEHAFNPLPKEGDYL